MSGDAVHGTLAGARAHYRRGEKPLAQYCEPCAAASRRRWAERRGTRAGNLAPDYRAVRNGLPFRPYVYRGTGVDVLTGGAP